MSITEKMQDTHNGATVVEVEHISKHYRMGHQDVTALSDVSLTIKEGEFVAIIGSSGSGKSTLLQLIGGLDKPSEGHIRVCDQDIARLHDAHLSIFRNQTIGFVFQFFYLQPFLNLETNIRIPGMFAHDKRQVQHERAIELAQTVGLSDRLHHLPSELSGGQMQRAAIARALFNKPKLLLADEPTGNLDSQNADGIVDLFETIRKAYNMTIVVVTHDAHIAARADRTIQIKDGRIA